MDINSIKRESLRFLVGLESGNLPASDLHAITVDLDPINIYFIVKYLRHQYGPGHPDAQGITTRLVELTNTYDDIKKAVRGYDSDPLNEWFEDDLNLADYRDKQEDFIEVLVEKIEG